MTPGEALDWLERHHTLHELVEILYVVDGYEVQVCLESGIALTKEHHGTTLIEAITKCAQECP